MAATQAIQRAAANRVPTGRQREGAPLKGHLGAEFTERAHGSAFGPQPGNNRSGLGGAGSSRQARLTGTQR